MTREQLIEQLEQLASTARQSHDLKPAAAVLMTLVGALRINADAELSTLAVQYAKQKLAGINRRLN